ncbi:MAG: molybdopterin-binding protein [Candidatus Limnocylindrales bacterium]
MRTSRIVPGQPLPAEAAGAVLVRDLLVGGERWPKGRRLSPADVARLADLATLVDAGPRGREPGRRPGITVLVLDEGDIHEDEAALRLAGAVAGPGTQLRGPAESRVDLLAAADGVLHIRVTDLERLDRLDPLEVFTLFDGQVVRTGELVASVKVAPHAVEGRVLDAGVRLAEQGAPLVRVAPFVRRDVAVVVKESLRSVARERFEGSIRARVEALGSTLLGFAYVPDELGAVEAALAPLVGRRTANRARVDLVLTAGAASTDPDDPFFEAIARLGGRVVRRGAPAHPGSMVWLARIGRTDLLGLPTCGAYSKATAADLLLPRLLTGERASAAMVARLGHGGVLTRAMRFRFPPYARELEAEEP